MWPLVIVKREVLAQMVARIVQIVVCAQVHFFIFDRPPQSLDEDVVEAAPSTVHADLYLLTLEPLDPRRRGELRSLIRVEDLRRAVSLQRLVERFDAKARVERVRQPPREHHARIPIDDRDQIDEAPRHRHDR